MDWNYFFSTFAQSAAAIIGILLAYLLSRFVDLNNSYAKLLYSVNEQVSNSIRLANLSTIYKTMFISVINNSHHRALNYWLKNKDEIHVSDLKKFKTVYEKDEEFQDSVKNMIEENKNKAPNFNEGGENDRTNRNTLKEYHLECKRDRRNNIVLASEVKNLNEELSNTIVFMKVVPYLTFLFIVLPMWLMVYAKCTDRFDLFHTTSALFLSISIMVVIIYVSYKLINRMKKIIIDKKFSDSVNNFIQIEKYCKYFVSETTDVQGELMQ